MNHYKSLCEKDERLKTMFLEKFDPKKWKIDIDNCPQQVQQYFIIIRKILPTVVCLQF